MEPVYRLCPDCRGVGRVEKAYCKSCNGTGKLPTEYFMVGGDPRPIKLQLDDLPKEEQKGISPPPDPRTMIGYRTELPDPAVLIGKRNFDGKK